MTGRRRPRHRCRRGPPRAAWRRSSDWPGLPPAPPAVRIPEKLEFRSRASNPKGKPHLGKSDARKKDGLAARFDLRTYRSNAREYQTKYALSRLINSIDGRHRPVATGAAV